MSIQVLADDNHALLYDSVEGLPVQTPVFDDTDFFSGGEAAALDFASFVEDLCDGTPAYRVGRNRLNQLRSDWHAAVERGERTEA